MRTRYASALAIVCSIAVIMMAILPWRGFDGGAHWHRVGWIPFVSRPVRVAEVVGNVLLFVPLGASVALHGRRAAIGRAPGVAFVCSFFGEWVQVYSLWKIPSSGDLIFNVLGAVLGAYGADYMSRRIREERLETGRARQASDG